MITVAPTAPQILLTICMAMLFSLQKILVSALHVFSAFRNRCKLLYCPASVEKRYRARKKRRQREIALALIAIRLWFDCTGSLDLFLMCRPHSKQMPQSCQVQYTIAS